MTLAAGTRLGHYEVVTPIGAGGMGEVYRARDTKLGRDVALKVLPERVAESPELRERFEREARAVASLSHPAILAIHDFGTEEETTYAVMELLEGRRGRATGSESPSTRTARATTRRSRSGRTAASSSRSRRCPAASGTRFFHRMDRRCRLAPARPPG
jgi:hypothetical protein